MRNYAIGVVQVDGIKDSAESDKAKVYCTASGHQMKKSNDRGQYIFFAYSLSCLALISYPIKDTLNLLAALSAS